MDDTVQKQNNTFFIITVLAIAVIVLLGVIGYAHYTKEITPKNKIVRFFTPNTITFDHLPLDVKEKYILKTTPIESKKEPQNIVVDTKPEQEIQNEELVNQEEVIETPSNKFLDKMATMQKETDETTIQQIPEIVDEKIDKIEINNTEEAKEPKVNKESQELSEKEKRRQKFLKKMAIMQKETDEMIIRNNGTK